MTCCRRAASHNGFIVRPLDGAFKRKTADEAKRNETKRNRNKTRSKQANDKQGTEHDNGWLWLNGWLVG